MDEEQDRLAWVDEMRAEHEAALTVGMRVRVDIGECPHFLSWHGDVEQGATGDIMGIDIAVPQKPADHRYWVWFDWPVRGRRSWSYAAHELTPIPKRTPEEVMQETLERVNAQPA